MNNLFKNTFIYGFAKLGTGVLGILMLPIYTRYFSPAEFGLWDVAATTGALITPFITFELVAAVYRWLLEENCESKRAEIITTGILAIIRNTIMFNVLAIVFFSFYSFPYAWPALGFINILIVNSFMQQCARGLRYNKLFAMMGIIQMGITLLCMLFFMFVLQLRVEAFFYAAMISGFVGSLVFWKQMKMERYVSLSVYSKGLLKHFLAYSMPIIPGAASWWILTMSDRYFISAFLGMEMNGLYAVANKIPAMLLLINSVFSLAWKDSAIVTFHTTNKDDYYSDVFKQFFRLIITSVICLTLVAKPLLAIAVSSSYFDAWKYIGFLMLGTVFHAFSLFWAAGFHGAKQTNQIFWSTVVGALVNVVINLLLISLLGLYAIAISTFGAFLLTWLLRIKGANKLFHVELPQKDMAILFPLVGISIALPFILSKLWLAISIFFSILLFIGFNWQLIKNVYKQIKHIMKKTST
ncbi:lipopolysaccharide biosynthesis protein [Virgibacillus sp. MG-45]|uniref:lipopolysaccharide biosynthesis protein n=1 Tax=Virgibacillus sp. MG-45 TaxID=3102791 RepID=UPI002ED7E525